MNTNAPAAPAPSSSPRPAWRPRSATSPACCSTGRRRDAADPPARRADQPDPRHRRRRGRDLDGRSTCRAATASTRSSPRRSPSPISAIPTGPACRRDDDPLARHADPRASERDREAAALDRDARLHLGDQLRQDRHADPEPDDGRRDDARRAALHDLRQRLLDRGQRSSTSAASRTSRSTSSCCRWLLASDAVVCDGEMIGDPTEGALVVLAEKGGLDAEGDARARTRASPSCRSTPPTS